MTLCTPPWAEPKHGTLLVVGSAPCLYEDYANALALRPDADTLLINEAGGAIEKAQHLLAGHADKAALFLAYRREKFPNALPVFVHATWRDGMRIPACVSHKWSKKMVDGGTSAWKAARIGLAMGYDEIILCGCPLEASGYFNPLETDRFKHDCARIGIDSASAMFSVYREQFARRAKERPEAKQVKSMSGFTRDCLGAPC